MTLSGRSAETEHGEIVISTRCRKTGAGAGPRQVTRRLTYLWSAHDHT